MAETCAVLFVCLGNICRSPLAEAAFRAEAEAAGLDVVADSAGTGGWHQGEPPDKRAIATAKRHGIDISGFGARKVRAEDFTRFSHIFALDRENLADLRALKPAGAPAQLSLLLDHLPGHEGRPVPDPYYGDIDDFENVWQLVSAAAKALAKELSETP